MRSYRQDRWAKAWHAIAPSEIHPLLKALGLILLGLFVYVPAAVVIIIARIVKWVLLHLMVAGEKTLLSIQIVANDSDS